MSMRDKASGAFRQGAGLLKETLDEALNKKKEEVQKGLEQGMSQILAVVNSSTNDQSSGSVNEEEFFTFMADNRTWNGAGWIALSIAMIFLLPGFLSWLAVLGMLAGVVSLFSGYIMRAKVDVPDGFQGVICKNGKPLAEKEAKSSTGRNWLFRIDHFIPFIVSRRDLVVNQQNANFTADFGSIGLKNIVTFRVKDPAVFIANSTPVIMMRILEVYVTYVALRMIVSVEDSRVKFVGRDQLQNLVDALNGFLSERYGIEVIRAAMPDSDNSVMNMLEQVRITLKEVIAMEQTKSVQRESATNEVLRRLRVSRREARSQAVNLQQERIRFQTGIDEETAEAKESGLIEARRMLEELISKLKLVMAEVKAKQEKSRVLSNSMDQLKRDFRLRKAALVRQIQMRMLPEQVTVLDVEGMGLGVGMSMGNQIVGKVLATGNEEEAQE